MVTVLQKFFNFMNLTASVSNLIEKKKYIHDWFSIKLFLKFKKIFCSRIYVAYKIV